MRFFFNDLSVNGQFANSDVFLAGLLQILKARDRSELIKNSLFCSRLLGDRPATANQTFQAAVLSYNDKDLKQRVLRWVAQAGPFFEDDRAMITEDLFYFADEDVTLQGLGEAARRSLIRGDAAAYSLPGAGNGCDANPLVTTQGLLEAKIAEVPVPNYLSIESMESAAVAALPVPTSWTDLLAKAQTAYDAITLSREIAGALRPHPFSPYVAERVFELLGILDRLVKSRNDRREFTEASHEIIANFFSGMTARFTDESKTNKNDYRAQMTFPDPEDEDGMIFCPFHGKINHPAYRIHIRWPLESRHDKIWVAYIGPKITV